MQRTVTRTEDFDRRITKREGIQGENLNNYNARSRKTSGDSVKPNMSVTLFVKGIPREMPEAGLYNLFSQHGKVIGTPIIIPSKSPEVPCTFAFVEVESEKDAGFITSTLNGQHPLYLHVSITKKLDAKFNELPLCLYCGADSYLFCSVCQSKYCSPKCQLADWPKHSQQCGITGSNQNGYIANGRQENQAIEKKHWQPRNQEKEEFNQFKEHESSEISNSFGSRGGGRGGRGSFRGSHEESSQNQESFFKRPRGRGGSHGNSDRGSRGLGSHFTDRSRNEARNEVSNDECWDSPKIEAVSKNVEIPLSRTYTKNIPLPAIIKSEFLVMPVEINSLKEIYVQELTDENVEKLEKFNAQLTTHCEAVCKPESYKPEVDELVGCKFENVWCRASIKSINNDAVTIFYIDYGNTETANVKDVVPLLAEMGNIPAFALHISLAGVESDITTSETALVKQCILNQACMIEVDSSSSIWPLAAKIIKNSTQENINDLVSAALRSSNHNKTKCSDKSFGQNNNLTGTSKALAANLPSPTVPVSGATVIPVFVNSSQEIFIQEITEENAERSGKLNKELPIYCESLSRNTINASVVEVGDLVGCKFEGIWCRGNIKKIDGTAADIFYVDYGNTEKVQLKEVVSLSSSFCSFPCLAVPVCLAGIHSMPTNSDVAEILNGVLNNSCLIEVENTTSWPLSVKLVNAETMENINDLVKKALGEADEAQNATMKSPVSSVISPKFNKANKVMAATIPLPSKLPPGSFVMPIDTKSPKNIYIQEYSTENAERFNELNNKLETYCEGLPANSRENYKPDIGELVGHKYEGVWCRGEVKGISDDAVTLFYTDYGNTETIELGEVVPLSSEFASFANIAISVYLAGLTLETFTPDVMAIINGIDHVVCKIEVEDYSSYPWAVKLIKDSSEENINELLREALETNNLTRSSMTLASDVPCPLVPPSGVIIIPVVVKSPQEIFILQEENVEKLDKFNKELENYCKNVAINPMQVFQVGDLVGSKFEDDWCRGDIKKIDGTAAEIFFVDYGNTEKVELTNVVALSSSFCNFPCFAVPVCLAGIPSKPFNSDVMEVLNGIVNIPCIIEIEKSDSLPLSVKLVNVETTENINNLVKQAFGDAAEKVKSPGSSAVLVKSNSTSKVMAANIPAPSNLPVGSSVLPIIIKSPKEIYIQECSQENVERLSELSSKLETYCESVPAYVRENYKPDIGELVGHKYAGEWCRGAVKEISNDSVTLFYTDYGNAETIKLGEVVPLSSDFASFPNIAIHVYLAGLTSETFPPDVMTVINGIVNVICKIEVEDYSSCPWAVKLVNLSSEENINELLKEAIETSVSAPKKSSEPASLSKSQETEDQLKYTVENSQIQLPFGVPLAVMIMHVESTVLMCCLTDKLNDIDQLVEEITKDVESKPAIPYQPMIEEICLARFAEDGRWYRATCLEVDSGVALVMFADFGNIESVPFKDLRAVEDKFMVLKLQVVMCKVEGMSADEAAKLKEKTCNIQIIEENEDLTMNISIIE